MKEERKLRGEEEEEDDEELGGKVVVMFDESVQCSAEGE